jgi:alkylation response protein AidB-like acyl-CoA dehydrogenase
MDFETSDFNNELTGLTREIVAGHVASDSTTYFDEKLWHELGKAGVLSAALPESVGGSGLGFLEQCGVLIELGRALAPAPYLPSIVLGASAIATFGTPEQQERWAVPAARGDILLTAALPDPAPHGSTPEPELGPELGPVLAAPWADAVLMPLDGAVYIVETSDAGVTVEPQELTNGVTAGRVVLDGVHLDAGRRLGGGAVTTEWLLARGTVALCALQLGVTERALEITAEYATQRVQFSRPIGAFQAVSQRLADAWIDVEAIRLTMWQAAWMLTEGMAPDQAAADLAISTAKFWAADAGHRVAHTAVHVHGGVGIDTSHPVHRYFAAAKTNEFTLGHATTQLRRIGAELAKL